MDKKLFQTKKKDKGIKGRIIRNIRNISGYEEEYYYKSVRADNLQSNNYIEYKSKGNRKTLSVEEYLNKTKPYLKGIINCLKTSDMCKIQLTIAVNFFFLLKMIMTKSVQCIQKVITQKP